MNGPDDEFDAFLARRKPVFGRAEEDVLEPPPELDRIVLRQARAALEIERPERFYRGPGWAAPMALAATLLLAFTVILNTATLPGPDATDVVARSVARDVGGPAPAPTAEVASASAQPNNLRSADDPVVVELAAPADERRPAAAPQAREKRADRAERAATARAMRPPETLADVAPEAAAPATADFVAAAEAGRYAPPPPAAPGESTANGAVAKSSAGIPGFRRDAQAWLAEIERLRAAGEVDRAATELAEYKRQHRAYAGAPDR